jgi:RimJ/RimL family protein N-acetyltransferase
MSAWVAPEVVEDRHVRLEPLASAHANALADAARDGELWRLWFTSVPAPGQVQDYIDTALGQAANGEGQAFAVRRRADDRIVGSTRFCNADAPNRRVEIGWTWYAASAQRSVVNSACKRLLLGHAFERLDCIAVELRTHRLNHRSRAAIERLGARLEGVLRNHRILADGSLRDTAVYSIIQSEWPAVRRHLDHQQERYA